MTSFTVSLKDIYENVKRQRKVFRPPYWFRDTSSQLSLDVFSILSTDNIKRRYKGWTLLSTSPLIFKLGRLPLAKEENFKDNLLFESHINCRKISKFSSSGNCITFALSLINFIWLIVGQGVTVDIPLIDFTCTVLIRPKKATVCQIFGTSVKRSGHFHWANSIGNWCKPFLTGTIDLTSV